MEQDDGAAELRLGLHGLQLSEDGLGDFGGSFAGILVPVVGVHLAADDGVSGLLDALDGGGLVVGVGLLVDVVGRAEVKWLNAELADEKPLGDFEFEVELPVGDFADVGMGVSVVADLVAFTDDALHEADIFLGLGADEHEGAFGVLLLEDVKDLRRPLGVGPVVEGERYLVGVVAVLLDGVGAGINVHVLIDDELFARVGLVGIDLDGALAGLGQSGDAENVAFALGVHVMAGLDGGERLQRVGVAGLVPDAPQ